MSEGDPGVVRRLAVWAVLCAMAHAAWGQAGTGSVSGVVRDPTGKPVPEADVEIANEPRAVSRAVKTDSYGLFAVMGLAPATGYTVTTRKAGFALHEITQIEVLVGEDSRLEVSLRISSDRTQISVRETPPTVDQTRTEASSVVRDTQILNLPVNGRRADTYVLMTPAVVPDGVLGLVSFRGIAGGNSFLTDGNDTSNEFFNENAGRTKISTQISQDAVQEFQVLSSGYSAEYGRASGGIINTVTRSGANRLFGTMYLFYRDRDFNARDPHSLVKPPEKRWQAGASIGGPLVKNRLLYFFNFETHRRDFPIVASLGRPPLFDANGTFVGTCTASAAQCSAALGFLGRQFAVVPRQANSELGFGKLDWTPSDRRRISASFNYLRWISPDGFQTEAVLNNGEGVGANGNSSVRTRYGRAAWQEVAGSLINEVRFGWFKDRHADNINPALVPQSGLVQITVEGQPNLGMSQDLPRLDPSENRFEIAETMTGIAGRHTWKFGASLVSTQDYLRYLRNRNGSYEYADFTHFALDFSGNTTGARNWQTYSQRFGNELYDERINDYDIFGQDQWRISPRVTLNYGLRYEYAALPEPNRPNPEYQQFAQIKSVKTNFAPRVGVAIGFNRSQSVLRAGYGIFYARYGSGAISTFFQENGVNQQSVQLERRFLSNPAFGPVFPNSLPAFTAGPPSSDPAFASSIDLTMPSRDYRNGYTQQGDVAIEHAFSPTLIAGASYLWSRGLHLTTVQDINIGPPGSPVVYTVLDASGKMTGTFTTPGYRLINRVNPNWRRVNLVESGGNSYYNALAVQVRKRVAKGFEGFLSYTWSHTIDYNEGGGADNIFFSDGPRTYANADYRGEKASSQLDQRHRMVASSTYESTWQKGASPLARAVLSHWRISQISTFASAQPATPSIIVSDVPFPGAAFNSTINGFGGSPRVPFLPASSLDIDQTVRTDARLTKVLPIGDRRQVHINFEAFNVFNRVSNTAVSTAAYVAKSLRLTPVANLGAGVASQGYPDGTNARRTQVSMRLIW